MAPDKLLPNTLHFVECDFGKMGRAFLETDPTEASEDYILEAISTGQIDTPILRIIAVRIGGAAEDVTAHIGELLVQQFDRAGRLDEMPAGARDLAKRSSKYNADLIENATAAARGHCGPDAWARQALSTRACARTKL